MFGLGPDETAALLAALTLGKEILRDQKRSAERSDADDCSPEPLRPAVSNADALALMVETAKRMSCDACVSGVLMRNLEILDLGRTQRLPNRAQRRALMVRDGGCRFPGCTERRYVEAHHVRHWLDGGPTDLANLVLLCWFHHHAVHEGGFRLCFEAGVVTVWRPDGTLVQSKSLMAEGPGIVEQNEALGLGITPESVASQWDGRPLTPETLADTVSGLLWLEDRCRRDVATMDVGPQAAEPDEEHDTGYPDVIVIDDEDDDGLAVA
jgi:hypothetical protein